MTESAAEHLSRDERSLKDLLLPVRGVNQAMCNELDGGVKVVLLMVKGLVDAVEFSRCFHASSLKPQDFENILKYVVVNRSDWLNLLRVCGLDSRYPKTLRKRLPNDFCEILRSRKQESFRICPGFYCLVDGCFGSIVIARWTKKLCEELTRCRVHGCVCKRCDEVKGEK